MYWSHIVINVRFHPVGSQEAESWVRGRGNQFKPICRAHLPQIPSLRISCYTVKKEIRYFEVKMNMTLWWRCQREGSFTFCGSTAATHPWLWPSHWFRSGNVPGLGWCSAEDANGMSSGWEAQLYFIDGHSAAAAPMYWGSKATAQLFC